MRGFEISLAKAEHYFGISKLEEEEFQPGLEQMQKNFLEFSKFDSMTRIRNEKINDYKFGLSCMLSEVIVFDN